MAGMMRVSVVATGIDAVAKSEAMPTPRRATPEPLAMPAAAARSPLRPEPVAAPAAAQVAPVAMPAPMPAAAPAPAPQPAAAHFADHAAGLGEAAYGEPEAAPAGGWAAPASAPRRAGEPSPEALARLQRAVQNVPRAEPMARPVEQPRVADRGSRLTINSLIHRMTGQIGREEHPQRAEAPAQTGRVQPQLAADPEDNERERVDIPAFLRRQAN
jgi:cell division protein FtsZ